MSEDPAFPRREVSPNAFFAGPGEFPPRGKGPKKVVASRPVTREATQELGGWRPEGVMERVYEKTRSKEVAPGMRCALDQARSMPRTEEFAKDVEFEASFDDGSVAGYAETCMFAPGLVAFLRSRFIRPPSLSDRRVPIYVARWAGGPVNWVCRTCRRG